MDSLSQIVLGSSVAALVTPASHRRRALLAGAILGTLPDLDSFPLSFAGADPVTLMTWHRGPSHSLLMLAPLGWLIWLGLRKYWAPVREAPRAWLVAIQLALLTHPLLDAFTIYGTQLGWPIPFRPVMGGSMFIIDPLYTLPLLIGCVVALAAPLKKAASRALLIGLALSSGYLGWSLVAQSWVERVAYRSPVVAGLQNAPRFITPTAFNTLLWRVVVMTPHGYFEGYHSLVADKKPIEFTHYDSDTRALAQVAAFPAVARLTWFNHGFMKAEVRGPQLILSDLRMGAEPGYVFRFAVAERQADGSWREIPVERTGDAFGADRVRGVWQRLWHEP